MSYSLWVDDLLELMSQTITLAPFTGRNEYNAETWGTARTYPARVSEESQALYDAAGQVIYSSTKIIIHPKALDATVLTTLGSEPDNAQLTLTDGSRPRILQVGPVFDEVGLTYWVIRT